MSDWPEVHGFRSSNEFARLAAELDASPEVSEVRVEVPYSGSAMFIERWFVLGDGTTWRLVAPEPPFTGVFEPFAAPQLPHCRGRLVRAEEPFGRALREFGTYRGPMADADLEVVLGRLPRDIRARVERVDCPDLLRQLTTPVPALEGRSFVEASAARDEALFRVLERWEDAFGTRQ